MKRSYLVIVSCFLLAVVLMLASCGPDEEDWIGLPPESLAAMDAARGLGEAVVSYFDGQLSLEAVEGLVAPSAREGLAQMLSSLDHPISPTVNEVHGLASRSTWLAVLRFVEAETQQPVKFALTFDADGTTIEAIDP